MRKIITADITYRIESWGVNQSFMLATENHGMTEVNLTGETTEWVEKKHFDTLRNIACRFFDAQDYFARLSVEKELQDFLNSIGE